MPASIISLQFSYFSQSDLIKTKSREVLIALNCCRCQKIDLKILNTVFLKQNLSKKLVSLFKLPFTIYSCYTIFKMIMLLLFPVPMKFAYIVDLSAFVYRYFDLL